MLRASLGRRILLGAAMALPLAVTVVGVGPALASGGGGCGRPLTDRGGVTVNIKDFCFSPTVLRVSVGHTVTWTNLDSFPHTVSGVNGLWGSLGLLEGDQSTTYRFNRAGVYPYACTLHPGMVGAVLVGPAPAEGPGSNDLAAVVPITPSPPQAAAFTADAAGALSLKEAPSPSAGASGLGWKVATWVELALLLGAGGILGRRWRRTMVKAATAA